MEEKVEILLCEDNKRDADLTIRSLKKKNVNNTIIWVKDGEEALDYLFGRNAFKNRSLENKPTVILLDLKMPKVDGLGVLKEVRSHESTKTIPVVILTSSEEEKDIVQSYELGVNSYIVKPVDFKKFSDSISEVGYYWTLLNKSK
ncbi:MAG: response regulator [Balneolaceae bacterium]